MWNWVTTGVIGWTHWGYQQWGSIGGSSSGSWG
jgi:hypothetical protein